MSFKLVPVIFFLCSGWIHAQADWTSLGSDGKLVYKTDTNGNRIMDFSTAGYMGGGVVLPTVPVKVTLNPSGGDDRATIQNAINQVAAMPLTDGFRGAVLLAAGTFQTSGSVNINASGVVVRGTGIEGTTIVATGGSLFNLSGSGSYSTSGSVNIADAYVPSGTLSVNVSSASGFVVGDNVLITKTVTAAWVAYVGMNTLVRDGVAQTWIAPGTKIITDRTITAITGNTITFDGPLTDDFDSKYLGNPVGTVSKYTFAGRITQSGIENLRITAPANSNAFSSIQINDAMDCWVRDIVIQDGTNCFNIQKNVRRVTVDNIIINHTVASTDAALPADFDCDGTQVLFNKCQSNGTGSWTWTTGGEGTGPLVVLNFKSTQNTGISPHMRWTTGILADGDTLPNAPKGTQGISFRNRGTDGSGHGWTTGWSVAWNVNTPYFLVSNAPGTLNWAIGGKGAETSTADPNGIYDHFDTAVSPKSLYLQQLEERLGPQALANIGYGVNAIAVFNPTSAANQNGFDAKISGLTLSFSLPQAEAIILDVYSVTGSLLNSARMRAQAGRNKIEIGSLSGSKMTAGFYFLKLSRGNETQIVRTLFQ